MQYVDAASPAPTDLAVLPNTQILTSEDLTYKNQAIKAMANFLQKVCKI